MSNSGEEAATAAGSGHASELAAVLTSVQSIKPLPDADTAAASAADLSEGVTSPPAVHNKSQTSRKRCRQTEVSETCQSRRGYYRPRPVTVTHVINTEMATIKRRIDAVPHFPLRTL